MKKNYFKVKSERGITLIALILTVTIMLIIAGISINVGMESFGRTELEGFYTELGMIQSKMDYVVSTNENGKILGAPLSTEQINKLKVILAQEVPDLKVEMNDFRYFKTSDIERLFGISDMKYDVFVNFKTLTIVAEKGIKVNGITYHVLPERLYTVQLNSVKNNKWAVDSLSYNIELYGKVYYPSIGNYVGKQQYLVTIVPKNLAGKPMTEGVLKYKNKDDNYWNTVDGFKFVVTEVGYYDILYEDTNQNKKQIRIEVK